MHLHDHFGCALLPVEHLLHLDHAEFYQVSRCALHRRIDGLAFGTAAPWPVRRADFGQVQAPAKHGLDITGLPCALAGFVHVTLDARITLEVTLDVIARGRVVDRQAARQTKCTHAINQAEVDDFGVTPLLTADLARRHAEHLGCGGAVDVHALGEGAQQRRVATDVGHDAQLDLAVVGTRNNTARRGHKSLAHTATLGRSDRDILQIRVVARQPPGNRHGLGIVGVHTPGTRVGELCQFVGVGALEFGQAPVFQNLGRQGEVFGQFFQHFLVGAGDAGSRPLDDGQAQLDKEYLADLLRAAQVKGLPGQGMRLAFELHDALAQIVALCCQGRRVDQHPVALDPVQRLAALYLELVDEQQCRIGLQQRPQRQMHIQCLVGVLTGILGSLGHIDLAERYLVHTFATQVLITDAAAPEVALGQAGQAMRLVHFEHITLQHGVVCVSLYLDAMVGKHVAVVFDVLAQLVFAAIFQPGFEPRQHLVQRQLHWRIRACMAQRNIGRFAGLNAETDAHNLGAHFVQRGGFGIHGHQLSRLDAEQPAVEVFPRENGVVGQRIDLAHSMHFGAAKQVWQRRAAATLLVSAGRPRRGVLRIQGFDQTFEAVSLAKHFERLGVLGAHRHGIQRRQTLHIRLQVAIGLDGQQFAAFGQPGQRATQVFANDALDLR